MKSFLLFVLFCVSPVLATNIPTDFILYRQDNKIHIVSNPNFESFEARVGYDVFAVKRLDEDNITISCSIYTGPYTERVYLTLQEHDNEIVFGITRGLVFSTRTYSDYSEMLIDESYEVRLFRRTLLEFNQYPDIPDISFFKYVWYGYPLEPDEEAESVIRSLLPFLDDDSYEIRIHAMLVLARPDIVLHIPDVVWDMNFSVQQNMMIDCLISYDEVCISPGLCSMMHDIIDGIEVEIVPNNDESMFFRD